MRKLALVLGMALAASLTARGQFVVPTSYTATPGGTGLYTYFDDTGSQLTDGILGVDNWQADLGHGPAYEWVGWTMGNPSVMFNFASNVTIQTVQIGFNRTEGVNIYLPTSVSIGGTVFPLSSTDIPDGTRAFLNFNGSWTGNSLQVNLAAGGAYTFVDEMKFSTTNVPEPGVAAALLGGVALGWAVWRRRRNS